MGSKRGRELMKEAKRRAALRKEAGEELRERVLRGYLGSGGVQTYRFSGDERAVTLVSGLAREYQNALESLKELKAAVAATQAATQPEWTPFERAAVAYHPAYGEVKLPDGIGLFKNSVYTVLAAPSRTDDGRGLIHLSIRRNDRGVVHDWRDLQRIKNELVGPEKDAIELYPAESRLVDEANQYHLWVLKEGRWPCGMTERRVSGNSEDHVQRPLGPMKVDSNFEKTLEIMRELGREMRRDDSEAGKTRLPEDVAFLDEISTWKDNE